MVAKNQHDYERIKEKLIEAIRNGTKTSWAALARAVDVDPGTLKTAAKREWGIVDARELLGTALAEPMPQRVGTTIDEQANVMEIDDVSNLVRTLDELLKVCKVDLEMWKVRDHVLNQWQVGMKVNRGGQDEVVVVPLYQVKVWLVRKVLIPIMPEIRPVEIYLTPSPFPNGKGGKAQGGKVKGERLKRVLIVPDVHMGFRRGIHDRALVPFHDRRVLDLAVQILRGGEFDGVHFIGDCMDLSEFSTKFTPEPEFYFTTQPALLEWAWWLGQFRASAPRAELVEYEGNHDKRMGDMIVAYMRAAYGLRPVDEIELPPSLSVERLLALHALGVEYVKGYPDNYRWLNQNVMVRHGDTVRAGPGDSAKAVVAKTTYTTIFGHVHRTELVTRRIKSRDGDIIQKAFCPGCACFTDGRVPGSTSDQQWQQGLAVMEYTDTEENIVSIPVSEGKAIYNGRMLRARDREAEIEKMIYGKLEKLK